MEQVVCVNKQEHWIILQKSLDLLTVHDGCLNEREQLFPLKAALNISRSQKEDTVQPTWVTRLVCIAFLRVVARCKHAWLRPCCSASGKRWHIRNMFRVHLREWHHFLRGNKWIQSTLILDRADESFEGIYFVKWTSWPASCRPLCWLENTIFAPCR